MMSKRRMLPERMTRRLLALLLTLCLMMPALAVAEGQESDEPGKDWLKFLLLCNEGMNNSGGNAGNTVMVVGMNPVSGKIRLMMFTWDTFINYEGYDLPQRLDMPYRNNGPEETVRVFNSNFDLGIDLFLSLNYLNLASLIDVYGGVDIDISRAERNALNAMVASKKENIQAQVNAGLLSQLLVELLADEYYLSEYGPETHLNGLQAVGFGWLQYDSVYNCCKRDAAVVASLFEKVAKSISDRVVIYTNESGYPVNVAGRRAVNLDNITDDDITFMRRQIEPIFQMSYNNLTEENIISIFTTLLKVAYAAARQGVDIFDHLETEIFPLEATEPYEIIAGARGHVVDSARNSQAMKEFLFRED